MERYSIFIVIMDRIDGKSPNTSGPSVAKNLTKGLSILNVVASQEEGLTLAEISRRSGVPKPTAHRLITVLIEYGMLRVGSEDKYLAGPQCLVLGNRFLNGLDLRQEAQGVLRSLAAETLETCHLGIREGTQVIYIEKVESPHAVRMYSRVGATNPVYSTSLGRVMIAHDEESVVEAVISAGLESRTSNTITVPAKFKEKLAEVRRQGFAIDDIENEEGIRCVAAPVFDHNGDVVAGISVSGPEQRLTLERTGKLATMVCASADALSRQLGYATDGKVNADGNETKHQSGKR